MRWPFRARAGVSGCLIIAAATSALPAQTIKLAVTGSLTFPTPTGTDYFNGAVYNTGYPSSGLLFTATLTGTSSSTSRTATVSIYSTSLLIGLTKGIAALQWACLTTCATGTSFTSLTCCLSPGTTIQSLAMTTAGTNNPWSNTLLFRMQLNWTLDLPGTSYSTGASGIVILVSMTTP